MSPLLHISLPVPLLTLHLIFGITIDETAITSFTITELSTTLMLFFHRKVEQSIRPSRPFILPACSRQDSIHHRTALGVF